VGLREGEAVLMKSQTQFGWQEWS